MIKPVKGICTPPYCLTIAGLDPCGGAGATADLRVFRRLKTHGLSAFTALTPQNTRGVKGIHPVPAKALKQELQAVFEDFTIAAAKTGQIPNKELAKIIVAEIKKNPVKLVIDPVMLPTRGRWLVEKDAVKYIKRYLLPLATVITPNTDEAGFLAEMEIATKADMQKAAEILVPQTTGAVIITGGDKIKEGAIDLFFDGEKMRWLNAKRRAVGDIHGSGCHFSAAIAAYLAQGSTLEQSVVKSKKFMTNLIDHKLLDPTGQMKLLFS